MEKKKLKKVAKLTDAEIQIGYALAVDRYEKVPALMPSEQRAAYRDVVTLIRLAKSRGMELEAVAS